jgi:hypothetical protein
MRTNRLFLVVGLALLVFGAARASAQAAQTNVGGLIFLRHWTDLTDNGKKKGYDQVDLDRVYLNYTQDLTPRIKLRVTTDIYQNSAATAVRDSGGTRVPSYYNGWTIRLKFGYADFAHLLPRGTLRLGLIPTHWFDYVEGLWKYRVVSPVLMDVEGQNSSADLGAGYLAKLPRGYGEFYAIGVNGTGYTSPENNRQKDYAGRLSLNLLPRWTGNRSLQVAGYYYNGYTDPAPNYSPVLYRNRTGVLGYVAYDVLSLGAEYDVSRDDKLSGASIAMTKGGGLSVFGELKAPKGRKVIEGLALLGRYDRWDPNTARGDTILGTAPDPSISAHTRLIGGIAYQVARNVRFILDGQRVSYRSGGYNGVANVNQDRLFQQLEVKF